MGTLMAALVLGGFVVLSMLAYDPQFNGSQKSLDDELVSQEREIALLSRELEGTKARHEIFAAKEAAVTRLDELLRKNREDEVKLRELAALQKRVNESGTELQAEIERYVAAYRSQVRSKAIGETMEKLVTNSGRTFENVTISLVSPAGINLRHADGMVRLGIAELPESLWERFQFDVTESDAFLKKERGEITRLEDGIDAAMKQGEREDRFDFLGRRIPYLNKRVAATRDRISNLRRHRNPDPSLVDKLQDQVSADQGELGKLLPEFNRLKKRMQAEEE